MRSAHAFKTVVVLCLPVDRAPPIIFQKKPQLLIICVHMHVSPFIWNFFFAVSFCMEFFCCVCVCTLLVFIIFQYYLFVRSSWCFISCAHASCALPTFAIRKWLLIFWKLTSKRTHRKPDRNVYCYVCATNTVIHRYSFRFWHHGNFMANFGIVLSNKWFVLLVRFFVVVVFRLKICQHQCSEYGTIYINALSQLLGRAIPFFFSLFDLLSLSIFEFWTKKKMPYMPLFENPSVRKSFVLAVIKRDTQFQFERIYICIKCE